MRNLEEEMSNMIERDPVSGNEVPPGAMPKEVRDDVDAKLSDGEYVLPADVVRYFGVAHIEKMVKQAKEGMVEMAQNGRINGKEDPRVEPHQAQQQAVPQPVPRQMAGGGYNFLPQDGSQPVQYPAMSQDGLSAAEELRKRQEAPVKMADGGYTSAANQILGNQNYGEAANQVLNTGGVSGFDAVRSLGRGFYGTNAVGGAGGMGSGGVETRTYINKAGERISVMFINGTPIADIPDGYVPDTPEGRAQFEQASVGSGEQVADPSSTWDEDGRDNAESNGWNDDKNAKYEDPAQNPYTMTGDDLLSRAQDLANPNKMLGNLGKVPGIGGLLGKGIDAARMAGHLDELEVINNAVDAQVAAGMLTTDEAAAIKAEINPKLDAEYSTAVDMLRKGPNGIQKLNDAYVNGVNVMPNDAVEAYRGPYTGNDDGATGSTGGSGGVGPVTTDVDANGTPVGTVGSTRITENPFGLQNPAGFSDASILRSTPLGANSTEASRNRIAGMLAPPPPEPPGMTTAGDNPWGFGADAALTQPPTPPTIGATRRVNRTGVTPPSPTGGSSLLPPPPEPGTYSGSSGSSGGSTGYQDNSSGAEDRRAEAAADRARETSQSQASDALSGFDDRVNSVVEKAEDGLATREEVEAIREEAERVRDALEARASGAGVGFAKGGLVARKAMRSPTPRRKIRTVER